MIAETPNERFERLAEAFALETGMMAPGKDVAADMGDTDEYFFERIRAWKRWLQTPKRET